MRAWHLLFAISFQDFLLICYLREQGFGLNYGNDHDHFGTGGCFLYFWYTEINIIVILWGLLNCLHKSNSRGSLYWGVCYTGFWGSTVILIITVCVIVMQCVLNSHKFVRKLCLVWKSDLVAALMARFF